MSAYFSKWMLNTYAPTPYFREHLPDDYPLSLVLQKCRAFRRLPKNLRELAGKAKEWTERTAGSLPPGIEDWYDDEGYELDPDTGERLTDEQIDEQWPEPDEALAEFTVADIPEPEEGFGDPETWEPTEPEEDAVDREGVTEGTLLADVASRGLAVTAKAYGVPANSVKTKADLVRAVLDMHGKPWPR